MAAKKLLVTGATGKQGGALISAILDSPSASSFTIYGLTRSAASAAAQSLAAKGIHIVEGDTTNPDPIFAQLGPDVWGVFSVTNPGKTEEMQGTAMVDAARAAGVQHFIFTSVDRGGPERSATDATPIPHFISKFNVEQALLQQQQQQQAAGTGERAAPPMAWTILRPVAFMDNLTPDFIGRCFARYVQQMGSRKLQLVGTADVGRVAAAVFLAPERYRNQVVTLAGDDVNFHELNRIFKEEMGYDLPLAYSFLATIIKWTNVGDLAVMFKWFEDVGYGADVQALKTEFPFMQDLRSWLRKGSKFERSS